MLAKIQSAAVVGIDAFEVQVELDCGPGLPAFQMVGLPDIAVKEARDRVKAAIANQGFDFPPNRRFTANLAPADMRKEGPAFDLPIAIGVLASLGQVDQDKLEDTLLTGELGLDGRLRPIKGALSMAVNARERGLKTLLLPAGNAEEAAVVQGIEVLGVEDLSSAVDWLRGELVLQPTKVDTTALFENTERFGPDLADVKGQEPVKRALEIAAAGGHNFLMLGPPGSGKTMLARCLPSILPRMTLEESVQITKIYSVAGLMKNGGPLVTQRPFRAPHHTISHAGLIGGGSVPRPGEVSLSHLGVLFLDELPEFGKSVLEVLRQPLEDGQVTISRAAMALTWPSRGMLAAAMNPCPCGHRGNPRQDCVCDQRHVEHYLARLSGPLLDRIDLHIDVPGLNWEELSSRPKGESSAVVRARVDEARQRQRDRFKKARSVFNNAQMGPRHLRKFCQLDEAGLGLMKLAVERMGLSARAYDRVLKVARTIADIENSAQILSRHLGEAIQYRSLDRPLREAA